MKEMIGFQVTYDLGLIQGEYEEPETNIRKRTTDSGEKVKVFKCLFGIK